MQIGDTIILNHINWQVLDIKGNQLLIITKDILEQRTFNDKYSDITWEHSAIRKYLNDDFYATFTDDVKEMIVQVINQNFDNQWYGTKGGNVTLDKVFLLSVEEVCLYFGNSIHLLNHPSKNQRYWFQRKDKHNINRVAKYKNHIWWWWLRSPGRLAKSAIYIHGDGNIGMQGNNVGENKYNTLHYVTKDNRGGIRPAMWINYHQ